MTSLFGNTATKYQGKFGNIDKTHGSKKQEGKLDQFRTEYVHMIMLINYYAKNTNHLISDLLFIQY